MATTLTRSAEPVALPASPPARRGRGRPWRDVRVVVGIALVVVCAVAGALLLSGGGGVAVWAAARDLPAGAAVTEADLVPVTVDLGEAAPAYALADQAAPGGRLAAPLRAGELLPLSAVVSAAPVDVRLVTLPVEPLHGPAALSAGEKVDVWATPRAVVEGDAGQPQLVLAGVTVSAVLLDESGASSDIGVVLEVPRERIGEVVAASRSGVIDLVRVPVGAAS